MRTRRRGTKVVHLADYAQIGNIGYQLLSNKHGADPVGWAKVLVTGQGADRGTAAVKVLESLGKNAMLNGVYILGPLFAQGIARKYAPKAMNPTIYRKGRKSYKLY